MLCVRKCETGTPQGGGALASKSKGGAGTAFFQAGGGKGINGTLWPQQTTLHTLKSCKRWSLVGVRYDDPQYLEERVELFLGKRSLSDTWGKNSKKMDRVRGDHIKRMGRDLSVGGR